MKKILFVVLIIISLFLVSCAPEILNESEIPVGLPKPLRGPANSQDALAGQGISTGTWENEFQLYNMLYSNGRTIIYYVNNGRWDYLGYLSEGDQVTRGDLTVTILPRNNPSSAAGSRLRLESSCEDFEVEMDGQGNYYTSRYDSSRSDTFYDSFQTPLSRYNAVNNRPIASSEDAITVHSASSGVGWFTLKCDGHVAQPVLRTAQILDPPIPDNLHCFKYDNRNNPECLNYYRDIICTGGNVCGKKLVCPTYYNPVCGADNKFYPTQCWAEELGTSVQHFGQCDSVKQFFRDLWSTRGVYQGESYDITEPNIEFEYTTWQTSIFWPFGVYFNSKLWKSPTEYAHLNLGIQSSRGIDMNPTIHSRRTKTPVIDTTSKVLLVYILFDDLYPQNLLVERTELYEELFNDYISRKQNVPNPIRYEFTPVFIQPPQGVQRISQTHLTFSNAEKQIIYDAAIQIVGQQDFDVITAVYVGTDAFGGIYDDFNDMRWIQTNLGSPSVYSTSNLEDALNSLVRYEFMWTVITNEVKHDLGLEGDHTPMWYGVNYLEYLGLTIDQNTGREITPSVSGCDFLGSSTDYYAVELPAGLTILVGQEPSFLSIEQSQSGPCLYGLQRDTVLKDADGDGEYELMHKFELIGVELQRSLGWIDVDGDNIAEVIDPNAYGGWQDKSDPSRSLQNYLITSTFQELGSVTINGCLFERIRIEWEVQGSPTRQTVEGLVPLQCPEFNQDIVNIYRGVKYQWEIINRDYGTVLIPRTGA
ncbi:MAG TPA: Kazal-type serine protease inhibitor [Candidatus Nanoarchaeia archaeon]|nr:Kazal-type serine protease inhibitor [Candidatus Nanoarchaeia archaeon]